MPFVENFRSFVESPAGCTLSKSLNRYLSIVISSNKAIARKYFSIELLLLLFVCYISPIISDVEYSGYEEKNIWHFTASLEYRLVYGTFSMLLYASYYWLVLKPLIFKKKIFYLILSIAGYIIVYHFSNKYEHYLVSKLPFLSTGLRLRAEKDFERSTIYFIISYALTRLVFTFIGFAFLIRSLQQEEEVKMLKEQKLTSELDYLKAQIQPHFFFNTLNNIYALALKQSKDTAPVVAKLADMMRYILYEANQPQTLLSKEIAFLNNYIDIEKIRYGNAVRIEFDIQVDAQGTYIQPLLLLPFVENAFKHGLHEEMDGGFVNVIIFRDKNELTLEVCNSKPVYQHTNKGVGLENVHKRLELLYPGKYSLYIKDVEDNYLAILTLQTT